MLQFTREIPQANVVQAWQPGAVRVSEEWLAGHVILSAERIIRDWQVVEPQRLTLGELEPAVALAPDIILLGTGPSAIFPEGELFAALAERGIGLEVMSTAAACRTFNVLLSEQRRVVAALFNAPPNPEP